MIVVTDYLIHTLYLIQPHLILCLIITGILYMGIVQSYCKVLRFQRMLQMVYGKLVPPNSFW